MAGILEGLRVIEMGQVVAVPSATAMLADWGAEVIKIEPPPGEAHRVVRTVQGTVMTEMNWLMHLWNRNKRGMCLNLKTRPGKDILHKLVDGADVFVANYEISTLKKLKVDYPTLSKINPGLVYAVLSGYGSVGPDKDQRGYDFSAAWARSGMMYMIGEPGSVPAPQRAGMIDSVAGSHVVGGICAALLHREKTGKGQEMEFSLYHSAV